MGNSNRKSKPVANTDPWSDPRLSELDKKYAEAEAQAFKEAERVGHKGTITIGEPKADGTVKWRLVDAIEEACANVHDAAVSVLGTIFTFQHLARARLWAIEKGKSANNPPRWLIPQLVKATRRLSLALDDLETTERLAIRLTFNEPASIGEVDGNSYHELVLNLALDLIDRLNGQPIGPLPWRLDNLLEDRRWKSDPDKACMIVVRSCPDLDLHRRTIKARLNKERDALHASKLPAHGDGGSRNSQTTRQAEDQIEQRLLAAISEKGVSATPDTIVKTARVNRSRGRGKLRELERDGRYRGFKRMPLRRV